MQWSSMCRLLKEGNPVVQSNFESDLSSTYYVNPVVVKFIYYNNVCFRLYSDFDCGISCRPELACIPKECASRRPSVPTDLSEHLP